MDPLQLKAQLKAETSLSALAELCDQFSEEERTLAIRALSKAELGKLYAVANEAPAPLDPNFFVAADLPNYTGVEWRGRNSLPFLSNFLKVMTRAPDGTLLGWNANKSAWAVGPGYFRIKPHPSAARQVVFDYIDLPAEAPPGWPKVKSNRTGGSFFVYRDLKDSVRPVGRNVVVAAAFDGPSEKMLGYYFALARGPLIPAAVAAAPAEAHAQ